MPKPFLLCSLSLTLKLFFLTAVYSRQTQAELILLAWTFLVFLAVGSRVTDADCLANFLHVNHGHVIRGSNVRHTEIGWGERWVGEGPIRLPYTLQVCNCITWKESAHLQIGCFSFLSAKVVLVLQKWDCLLSAKGPII